MIVILLEILSRINACIFHDSPMQKSWAREINGAATWSASGV